MYPVVDPEFPVGRLGGRGWAGAEGLGGAEGSADCAPTHRALTPCSHL